MNRLINILLGSFKTTPFLLILLIGSVFLLMHVINMTNKTKISEVAEVPSEVIMEIQLNSEGEETTKSEQCKKDICPRLLEYHEHMISFIVDEEILKPLESCVKDCYGRKYSDFYNCVLQMDCIECINDCIIESGLDEDKAIDKIKWF